MSRIASDTALGRSDVELAAEGDELAFARLIDAHHVEMIRLAYVVTGDAALAEDAVQTAWVNAWRKLPSVRDPARIRAWLLSIVANEARQIVRRRRRVRVIELDPELLAARSDPAEAIARIDLVRALAHLSSDDRSLMALRYVLGFDAIEIGVVRGQSASGIRARLSRLTARLRRELSDA